MNNILKVGGLVLLGIVLVGAGVAGGVALGGGFTAREIAAGAGYLPGPMMGFSRFGDESWSGPNNRGWGGRGGMMGGYGAGMMGGYPGEMMGGRGGGMMGGFIPDSALVPDEGETLTLDQAVEVAEAYLAEIGDDNLEVAEVMQFDNHFYAEIEETDTGIHAMELLIDPQTAAVYPEPGPNMMWNLKYGHHAAVGFVGGPGMMGGGMMGYRAGRAYSYDADSEMTVTPDEALDLAQSALDEQMPGADVADEVDTFYGYYTIHILQDGETVGMLSVNGFSGEVWLHTWHGEFIAMTEELE